MNDDERAERRAAIRAIERKPQQSVSAIREAARLARKNHSIAKMRSCQTPGCRTITFGGHFCTLCCSAPVQSIVPRVVEVSHVEKTNLTVEPFVVDHTGLVDTLPPKQIGPIGIAVVCLMVVLSLVAAYAQKTESSERAGQSLVAD
jgi:hypothetical protein